MNVNELSRQIRAVDGRIAAFEQRAAASSPEKLAVAEEAIEELRITLEELRVVEEELRVQNNGLALAREGAEAERRRYQALFEFAPDSYLVTDEHGKILAANRAACGMFRIAPGFLIGKLLVSLLSPDDRRGLRLNLIRLNVGEALAEWEARVQPRGSAPRDVALTAAATRSREGKLVSLLWMLRDVTERKRAAEEIRTLSAALEQRVHERTAELQAANQRNEETVALIDTLLATAPAGFAFVDTDLRYVRINESLAAMNGLPADAHLGRTVAEMMPWDWPMLEPLFRRALRGESVLNQELAGERRGQPGVVLHCLASYYPVRLREQVVGVGVVVSDITDRKRAEEALNTRYERERHIAETLQRTMLEEVPEDRYPELAVTTFYDAALDEVQVGGDFFDSFAISETRVALVVGDASGKGLAAAARAFETKYALRSLLRLRGAQEDLPAVMARLNRFVCDVHRLDSHESNAFLVLSLAVVDTGAGTVEICLAGAEPPLVIRASGTAEAINEGGLPLGVMPGEEYTAETLRLAPDDTLLMVTDGITEARRGDDFLGHEGVTELAGRFSSAASLREMGAAVLTAARSFAGDSLHDDACLLLARRRQRSPQ